MKIVYLESFDIPSSWYSLLKEVWNKGVEYCIERGSFEGRKRKELDYVTVRIINPSNRPLCPTDIPSDVPSPSNEETIRYYFQQLVSPHKFTDEDYSYGERLAGGYHLVPYDLIEGKRVSSRALNQLEKVIEMLKNTPNTNQACMEVGSPYDLMLEHPPCLRVIDCRIRYNKLHFFLYFRSWDLYSGYPSNMGAIQLLKEYMSEKIGVEDGELIASSKGLHLYDFQYPYVKRILELKKYKATSRYSLFKAIEEE